MDAGNAQEPSCPTPAGQKRTHARPGVDSARNPAGGIDCLHQAERFLAVDLGKASGNIGLVEIDEIDAAAAVEPAHAISAGPAKGALAVEENGEFRHELAEARSAAAGALSKSL